MFGQKKPFGQQNLTLTLDPTPSHNPKFHRDVLPKQFIAQMTVHHTYTVYEVNSSQMATAMYNSSYY